MRAGTIEEAISSVIHADERRVRRSNDHAVGVRSRFWKRKTSEAAGVTAAVVGGKRRALGRAVRGGREHVEKENLGKRGEERREGGKGAKRERGEEDKKGYTQM